MSFKKKLENFWYYHKAAVILIVIFLAAGMLSYGEFSKTVPSDLTISLISSDALSNGTINFNEAMPGLIQDIDNNGDANTTIARLFISDELSDDNAETMKQSLEAQLANKGATLFIADKPNFEKLMTRDAFCPLNELLDVSIYGDRVCYRGDTPIALSLKGSKVLADMEFLDDDLYALVLFRRPGEENDPVRMMEYNNAVLVMTELMK